MTEPEKTATTNSHDLTKYEKFMVKINVLRKTLDNFLENYVFVSFMSVLTIYILFADDIRSLVPNKNVDNGFYTMASVAFGLFGMEIVLSCLAKPGYFFGFFFWLDIISTVSLIFDIGQLNDMVLGTSSSNAGSGAAKLARAGRASRVGTRASRIVRVVRLIRLIRIIKLYKAAQSNMAIKEEENNEDEDGGDLGSHGGTMPRSNTIHPGGDGEQKPASLVQVDENGVEVVKPKEASQTDVSPSVGPGRKSIIDSGPRGSVRKSIITPKHTESEPKTSIPVDNQSAVSPQQSQDEAKKEGEDKENKETPEGEEKKAEEEPAEDKWEIPQETNVGKKLSTLTTKRVVTLVMSVLISIPIFDIDTYNTEITSGESGLNTVWALNESNDSYAYNLALSNYIDYHKGIRNKLLVVNIQNNISYSVLADEDSLRTAEKTYYNLLDDNGNTIAYSLFDQRDDTHLNAILSMSGTVFVTIVLTVAALYFSKDSNDLVLAPIENMLAKVKRISDNPLAAAQIEEEEALLWEKLEKEGKFKDLIKKKDGSNYETNILEKTILKLGALLALGFGEAGSNIIAQNMSKNGDVDPMIPGKKVMAIFGFCDIRQFTDATEVLQEGVMVFVNEIAEIVHGVINDFSGAANKNIGDAFLLVWKFPDDQYHQDEDTRELILKEDSVSVNALADMSVFSFIKVLAACNKSKKLDKYRHHAGLNQRIKNYSVKMGFGLHVGWAIEGAIGSEYKIDASYLSPNVNMAARLEAATKQFGVPVLISGSLVKICSEDAKKHLRLIDRVTVKGSIQPMDLYTCDVDVTKIPVDKNEKDDTTLTSMEKKQQRYANRVRRDELKEKAFAGKQKIAKKFVTDKDVALIRKPFTREFMDTFQEGMDNYISGNWSRARDIFEITAKMISSKDRDGPSMGLLTFMGEKGYRAPHDWKGYRELNEK